MHVSTVVLFTDEHAICVSFTALLRDEIRDELIDGG